jgi:alcohol dehydrogenase
MNNCLLTKLFMFKQEFSFLGTPQITFGAGSIKKLGALASRMGKEALLLRNRSITQKSGQWGNICQSLKNNAIEFRTVEIHGEPSSQIVDATVKEYGNTGIEVVIAVGGGSVIDAGKAISAMLPIGEPVDEYLEDSGKKIHPGTKVPFIAVPTTAGTGSEASANAVLSRIGPDGFKKSLRHDNLVPDAALVDPALTLSCPAPVTAACGMDAFTQLMEAYVSPKASPMTDALIESALPSVRNCLIAAATYEAGDIDVRAGMAYAALVSGIALANAGLGVVHGMAAAIGGSFTIPHGVVCGTLLGKATEITIAALKKSEPSHPALTKYARAGSIISGKEARSIDTGCNALVKTINSWTEALPLPRLADFGITPNDSEKIAAGSSNKNNPVKLTREEIAGIIASRI